MDHQSSVPKIDAIHELKNYSGLDNGTMDEILKMINNGEISADDFVEQFSSKNNEHNDNNDKNKQDNNKNKEDSNRKEIIKTEHLWVSADENIMPMLYCRTSIYLTIEICGRKVKCLLDTGAQNNIITRTLVNELQLDSFVDNSYKCKVVGVGTSEITGIIPYIEVTIDKVHCPLYFNVMDKVGSFEAILGLPFMMFYKVQLDFGTNKMKIMGQSVDMHVKEG
jgi:hypothetical protein